MKGYDAAAILKTMEKNGLLKEISPKVVILETVERSVQGRFGKREIKDYKMSKETFIKFNLLRDGENKQNSEHFDWFPNIMVEANIKYIFNKIKYRHHKNQLSGEVNQEILVTSCFTNPNQEKLLLFYHDDLWYQNTKINYTKINQAVNDLSDCCSQHGIQLVFMVCADKFDLYYPYLKDKENYAPNPFFEEFETYPKRYIFINTKKMLQSLLAKGERDVYWMDDTHWSWKGQQRTVDVLIEELAKSPQKTSDEKLSSPDI